MKPIVIIFTVMLVGCSGKNMDKLSPPPATELTEPATKPIKTTKLQQSQNQLQPEQLQPLHQEPEVLEAKVENPQLEYKILRSIGLWSTCIMIVLIISVFVWGKHVRSRSQDTC